MTTTIDKCPIADASATMDSEYCHDYFERLFRSNFFKCLNDETRQKIVLLLGQEREEGMRVADIAAHFDLDRTTVSHHLTMLRENNLLKSSKRGKERIHFLNTDYMVGVLEEMANILKSCCK